jgi:ribonuclease P protein component
VVEEARREAHIPTQQPSPQTPSRIPPSHERSSRSGDHPQAQGQGSPQAVGLIHRVRLRSTFSTLQASTSRGWAGPLGVVFAEVPDLAPAAPPQVAFAIGRQVGNAVRRNRLRRQLRAIFAEMVAEPAGLTSGAYLVKVKPSIIESTYQDMKELTRQAIAEAMRRGQNR